MRDCIRNPDRCQQRASHRFVIFQRRSLNNISSYTLYQGTPRPRNDSDRCLSAIRLVSRRSNERGILRVYVPHARRNTYAEPRGERDIGH